MACPRCARDTEDAAWCGPCELAFDGWSRRHAGDLVWEVLPAMFLVAVAGMGLPLLGASWLVAVAGVFAGFGSFAGMHALNRRRRRRQFLRGGAMPRAYLPEKS
ncbi:MAG: hypothetical protein ACTHU0_26670 [Kofleriaceae bacterium]